MAHCLSQRKARIQQRDVSRAKFSGIEPLVFELVGVKQNGTRETDRDAIALILQLMEWVEQKNQSLHSLLTVHEVDTAWASRLQH